MKYSPIDRTDRNFVGENWTTKEIRAISAILQVTKGVVAAGSNFFFKAFGKNLTEYHEILAMPRDLIMFRSHFEENGKTEEWRQCFQALSDSQKAELMLLVSHTKTELKELVWPAELMKILPYYLIKYRGEKETMIDGSVQLSLLNDADIVIEDE